MAEIQGPFLTSRASTRFSHVGGLDLGDVLAPIVCELVLSSALSKSWTNVRGCYSDIARRTRPGAIVGVKVELSCIRSVRLLLARPSRGFVHYKGGEA